MEKMRQLIRILLKLMPKSVCYLLPQRQGATLGMYVLCSLFSLTRRACLAPPELKAVLCSPPPTDNKSTEHDIIFYLDNVFGKNDGNRSDDAPPYPQWGLDEGWETYLSREY